MSVARARTKSSCMAETLAMVRLGPILGAALVASLVALPVAAAAATDPAARVALEPRQATSGG